MELQATYLLTLYQVLLDDDDEIRDAGAEITSRLRIGKLAHDSSLVPAVARGYIRSVLLRNYSNFELVIQAAIDRLTGTNEMILPRQLMLEATQEQNELFHKERQNLYVDEVDEAEAWSAVLQQMEAHAIPEETLHYFRRWVSEGLEMLTMTCNEKFDAALGWTSRSEVFTLGMRIIYAAHTLLLLERSRSDLETPALQARERLQELLDVGQRTGLHELWIQQIEIVLKDTV